MIRLKEFTLEVFLAAETMILGVLAGEDDQSTGSLLHLDARHRVEVRVLHLRGCQIDKVALESLLICSHPLLFAT